MTVFEVSMHVGTENFYQVGDDLLNHKRFQVPKSYRFHVKTPYFAVFCYLLPVSVSVQHKTYLTFD